MENTSENVQADESFEPSSVDQVFGQDVSEPQAEVQETAPVEETPPPAEVAPAPAETPAPAPETPKPDPAAQGLLAATISERKKRQALEQELAQLRQQIAQPTYQEPVYQDPGDQRFTQIQRQVDDRITAMSEFQARQVHPDYDEKLTVFAEACKENPALWETVQNSVHPAEAAYQAGKAIQLQKKYGSDPEQMIAKVKAETEAELRERIRAEELAKLTGKAAAKANQPTNLSTVRSAAGGGAQTEWRPTSVDQIFGRKRG